MIEWGGLLCDIMGARRKRCSVTPLLLFVSSGTLWERAPEVRSNIVSPPKKRNAAEALRWMLFRSSWDCKRKHSPFKGSVGNPFVEQPPHFPNSSAL